MLEITNVNKKIGKKHILRDVNIQFEEGGIYALLGPNGAGKTTLMRCICGLYPLCSGNIAFDGRSSFRNAKEFSIGYLPQNFGLFKELTVLEMMEYFASLKELKKAGLKEEIEKSIAYVNLSDKLKSRISTLSGGMVRRLGIAQAILGNPQILILDEPTAGLDPEERIRFKNIVAKVSQDKIVIISTHIVEDVEAVCNQIVVMNEGKVMAQADNKGIQEFAKGKVFLIDEEEEKDLQGNFFIVRRSLNNANNKTVVRILANALNTREATHEYTVEDGYICLLKNFC